MMLGEMNYQDLYYPKKQFLNNTRIEDNVEDQQFPGTAQLIMILFLVVFSLVIMNLLVGMAVSDIQTLSKSGKRNQLIAQIELIGYVENMLSSKGFKLLPPRLQIWLKNKVLCLEESFKMEINVRYSDITDTTLSKRLKKLLHQHCLRFPDQSLIDNV